jgi:hypothetical protein
MEVPTPTGMKNPTADPTSNRNVVIIGLLIQYNNTSLKFDRKKNLNEKIQATQRHLLPRKRKGNVLYKTVGAYLEHKKGADAPGRMTSRANPGHRSLGRMVTRRWRRINSTTIPAAVDRR